MRSTARCQKKWRRSRDYQTSRDGALDPPGNRIAAFPRFLAVEWTNHLQWPAMGVTLLSAWLVAAQSKKWRQWGFWFFLLSNVLWAAWAWHASAYALILLQIGLAALNIRGAAKND